MSDHTSDDESSTQDLGVYEMLWDCRYCGHKKNLGKTHRHCPSCGAAQDPAWAYFPSPEDAILVADHEFAGADLICRGCQAPMGAKAKNCGNCGAPLDGAKQVQTRAAQHAAEGQSFAAETSADAKRERTAAQSKAPPPKKRSFSRYLVPGVLGIFGLGLLMYFLLRKHEAGVVVSGHSWQREIKIDRYGPQPGSAWCDSLPLGAITISRSEEQRSTREIPDGQTCGTKRVDHGDGTFKMQRECKPKYRHEPVYAEKCHYVRNAWQYARSATANGKSLSETPTWPDVSLRAGSCIGCEREANRSETYELQFVDEKTQKEGKCAVPVARWLAVPDKSRWIVRVGETGADCDGMTAAQ